MPEQHVNTTQHEEDVRSRTTQDVDELSLRQRESQAQKLPEQKVVFKADSIKSRAGRRGAHNLPDQTNPPMGFDPDKAYDNVFPFLKLPYLQPNTPEDVISFGSPAKGGYLDQKHKRIPLNSIFFGDNLHVLRALPSNSIDLIYGDPPFFSGKDYNQIWGEDNEIRTFFDIWEDGLPSYLVWLNARLWEMRRVLKDTGAIYIHCDWHSSHYIKCEMDKIFGYQNFINEIIRKRQSSHNDARQGARFMRRLHDVLLLYSKTPAYKWTHQYDDYDDNYVQKNYRNVEADTGRRYSLGDLSGPGGKAKGNPFFEFLGVEKYWKYNKAKMMALYKNGRIVQTKEGNVPREKRYLDEMPGVAASDIWLNISPVQGQSGELIGYPTQKPEALLERVIKTSTEEGDTVADFFMGGGTTCAVAQKFNRKFIGCDISRVATSVALNRLIKDAEELSGRTASINKNKANPKGKEIQQTLELTIKEIPDTHVFYMGVYPIEKFEFIDQKQFEDFILTCYEARRFTGEGKITGVMNAATTILIGAVKPHESISEAQLKAFVEDALKLRYQPNVKLKLKVISWVFPQGIQKYAKVLENYFFKKNLPVEIELIPINSQLFRQRILEHYKDASKNEFLLKFISQPSIMDIAAKKVDGLKYRFEALGARSNNIDGYLINCQWDFNYLEKRFGESEYALMREQKDGRYVAVLKAEKEFEKAGKYTVACRVQDNFGGEIIRTKEMEIKS